MLSGELISSFTVLWPGLFQSGHLGELLVTIVGIVSIGIGLWIVHVDIDEFRQLTNRREGYVYTIPIGFVALDLYSTLAILSINSQAVELNPFVASAIQYGFVALVPFLISYLTLSQGLALLMVRMGRWLFGESSSLRTVPFSLICGASSFGPLSNVIGVSVGYNAMGFYLLAGLGSIMLALIVAWKSRALIALRSSNLN